MVTGVGKGIGLAVTRALAEEGVKVVAAALTDFCKALSKEVGPRGVRVDTVSPGPVETDLRLGRDGVAATVAASSGASTEDVIQGPRPSR
ncbi:SDR family oxidoreductase [Streptomyces yanii]|uniref:SDR family oxidoreductase n=1 Tax=Streptomyces yanii TaxID=78510 RepID=UPI0031EF36A4